MHMRFHVSFSNILVVNNRWRQAAGGELHQLQWRWSCELVKNWIYITKVVWLILTYRSEIAETFIEEKDSIEENL